MVGLRSSMLCCMGACVIVGEVPICSGSAGSGLFFVEGEVPMAMVYGGGMYARR